MTLDALLQIAHLIAILTAVVFLSSMAALCRPEWLNAAVVRRLGTVDRIWWIAVAAVLLTGLLRVWLGGKGARQTAAMDDAVGLLHAKLALFVLMAGLAVPSSRAFARWRQRLAQDGSLPAEAEIRLARKGVMRAGHVVPLLVVPAAFIARGFGG